MVSWIQLVVTIICSVLASSGFWAFLQKRAERKAADNKQTTVETQMLIGLAHDRIVYLGMQYIERGYVTQDQYENLFMNTCISLTRSWVVMALLNES